jgi:hypothetical protein
MAYVGFVALFVCTTLCVDSGATWATFRLALPDVPIRYWDTMQIRGASYLLSVLHYGAGQGGMAVFLHRRHQVPLARATGSVMLTAGVNVVLVTACAALGVSLGGAPASPALRFIVLGLCAGLVVYLVIIASRPAFLVRYNLLRPLFDAGLRGHAVVALTRLPHIVVLLVGHFLAMQHFGIRLPITQALALLPLLFAVSVLPISPAGLGTAQATAVALFTPFAPGETLEDRRALVLAYSLTLQFLGLIFQALVGAAFLRIAVRAGNVDWGGERRA